MSSAPRYAHSLKNTPPTEWQPLLTHCDNVAALAEEFARPFAAGDWAKIAGTLHDFGKASDAFQAYLRTSNGLDASDYDASGPSNHSGAGAAYALEKYGPVGRLFAYLIAGHHAGLADWIGGRHPGGALSTRLESAQKELNQVRNWLPSFAMTETLPVPPRFSPRELHLWIRMLYSCLVDADFLDTEAFMSPQENAHRHAFDTLENILPWFTDGLDAKQKAAPPTPVNTIRAEIRTACQKAAARPPGFFSLSVPTGGGKTLSATDFALRHAVRHNKRRVIYVIPYTSIIEQTADVLREFVGTENVVEHHSNLDPDSQTKAARLAAENWDAPIIVTTSVQFFESLFAARSSRCRKLHNIVDSVVILDEIQLLPPELLDPCTDMMRQLVERYGVSIVLSTATQPALPNLGTVMEIIPRDAELPRRLRRVRYALPDVQQNVSRTWPDIAAELLQFPQVLCVVNTRRDCLELFNLMPKETIHLSASMCGAHRSAVIARIKENLSAGRPIRVISTQLVEAGVDIDFPVVYRALAGLDSIAQSAGRCNREGKLTDAGKVVVFIPPHQAPRGLLRKAEDASRLLLYSPLDMEADGIFTNYFSELYSRVDGVFPYQDLLFRDAGHFQFQFREAAEQFQMIDQSQQAIFVRYGEGEKLIDSLRRTVRADVPFGGLLRKLQRYTVTLPRPRFQTLRTSGLIEEFAPGMFVWNGSYSGETGADIFNDSGILSAKQCVP